MLLEPIYEQDFLPCSHGFRPGRSAHDALAALRTGIMEQGHRWVIDADVSKYFDTIDHRHLRGILDLRIKDGVVRRMIDKWLRAGVLEEESLRRSDSGTPQGGVVTPCTQKVTSASNARLWNGEIVLQSTCAVKRNNLMTNDSFNTITEGRAAQRRLYAARPGRRGERSRDTAVAALRAVPASVLSLRPVRARHAPAGRADRRADPDHHQDSGNSGGDPAGACQAMAFG